MHHAKVRKTLRIPRHDVLLTIGGQGKIGAIASRRTLGNGIRIEEQSAIAAGPRRVDGTTRERAHQRQDEQQGGRALPQIQIVHGINHPIETAGLQIPVSWPSTKFCPLAFVEDAQRAQVHAPIDPDAVAARGKGAISQSRENS